MLGLGAFACVPAGAASIISDGGFETPGAPTGSYIQYLGGQTIGAAWTVVGNDVVVVNTSYTESPIQFNAEEGDNSLDLTGAGNSGPTNGVMQTITTTAGQEYEISFYVGTASGNASYNAPATDNLNVGIVVLPETNFNTTTNAINWERFTYDFVANGSSTTITFTNGASAATNEAGLDNVSVTAIPLPSSGIGGLILFAVIGAAKLRASHSTC